MPGLRRKETNAEPSSSSSSSSPPSSSAEAFDFPTNGAFSDDLLLEIFVRLPDSLSAIRCSGACKQWRSVISNPEFIRRFIHHNRLPSRQVVFNSKCTFLCQFPRENPTLVNYQAFSEKNVSLFSGRINFLPPPQPHIIRASCNDLLLISSYPLPSANYYICNPFTSRWIHLPQPPWFYNDPVRFGLSVKGFSGEPDQQHTRFRVVLMGPTGVGSSPMGPTEFCARIFCSETWKWTKTFVSAPRALASPCGDGARAVEVVACDGVLYWIDNIRPFSGIVGLDLFDEMPEREAMRKHRRKWHCRFINRPTQLAGGAGYFSTQIVLGACLGRLRLCCLNKREALRIWELREDNNNDDDDNDDNNNKNNSSWYLQYVISWFFISFHVLGFHPNNADLIFVLFNSDASVYRYDIQKHIFEWIGKISDTVNSVKGASEGLIPFPLMHPFWPTLLPMPPSSV